MCRLWCVVWCVVFCSFLPFAPAVCYSKREPNIEEYWEKIDNEFVGFREKSVLAKSRPRGPKESPKEAQALQGTPGEAQGWPKTESRQEKPKKTPREPGAAQGSRGGLGAPAQPLPGEPQERPWSPTGTRPEGTGQEETRGDKTSGRTRQEADKRSSGATKPRTPWPVSNLLLMHIMYGSTLVFESAAHNTKAMQYTKVN